MEEVITEETTTTTTTTTTRTIQTFNNEKNMEAPHVPLAISAGTPIPVPSVNPIKNSLVGVPAKNYFLHADKVVTIQSRDKIPAAVQV